MLLYCPKLLLLFDHCCFCQRLGRTDWNGVTWYTLAGQDEEIRAAVKFSIKLKFLHQNASCLTTSRFGGNLRGPAEGKPAVFVECFQWRIKHWSCFVWQRWLPWLNIPLAQCNSTDGTHRANRTETGKEQKSTRDVWIKKSNVRQRHWEINLTGKWLYWFWFGTVRPNPRVFAHEQQDINNTLRHKISSSRIDPLEVDNQRVRTCNMQRQGQWHTATRQRISRQRSGS